MIVPRAECAESGGHKAELCVVRASIRSSLLTSSKYYLLFVFFFNSPLVCLWPPCGWDTPGLCTWVGKSSSDRTPQAVLSGHLSTQDSVVHLAYVQKMLHEGVQRRWVFSRCLRDKLECDVFAADTDLELVCARCPGVPHRQAQQCVVVAAGKTGQGWVQAAAVYSPLVAGKLFRSHPLPGSFVPCQACAQALK